MNGQARRKPGRTGWEWRGYVSDELGRRKRVSTYGRTKAEALEKAEEVIARSKAGVPVRDSKQSVGAWLRYWAETILPTTPRAVNTVEQYRSLIRTHLAPAFEGVSLGDLRPSGVQLVLAELEARGLSASTRRSAYATLRAALDAAVTDRLLARNPVADVKRPKASAPKPRAVEDDKVVQLLAAARGHRFFPILFTILETGLRRGEALALEWDDIDLDALELEVNGTLVRVEGGLKKLPPKSAASRRRIPISSALANELRKARATQLETRLALGGAWGVTDRGGYVFTSNAGGPIEPRNLSRWHAALCSDLGIEEKGLHAMRHSAATAWITTGTDARTVAELLGHADGGALALRVYATSSDELRRKAVEDRSRRLWLG